MSGGDEQRIAHILDAAAELEQIVRRGRVVGIAANGLALCPHNHLRRTLNSNAILPRCQRRAGGRISTAGEGSA